MAKVAVVATGLAMATSMLSLAPIAHAATSCSFTTDLTVGATGAAVTCLQQSLIANGYSIPAGATGYFGMQTKAAVAAWQAASGVSPAVGYFGPISRAAFTLGNTAGGATGGTSTVPGCLPGYAFSPATGQSCAAGSVSGLTGLGRLTNISSLGDVSSDLDEGDATTAVMGVSADATGGDVAIQRVDAEFTIASSGGSSNLNKYVSDVSLWLGSTKLASMDPALGDKDGRAWTYRFSGLSNAIIKSGATGNIYVKVTPVESIGADEDGDTITVDLDANSVRAVGGDGISDTYVADDTISGQTFTVSSSDAGTLTITAANDNPTASQVTTASTSTNGVKLLSFNMKAKNTNAVVTDVVASFGTSDDNLNDVISTVYLNKGSTVLKSKTLSTGTYGTITFSDVNQTISKDSTENYTITADLKGQTAALYVDGTTIVASTTTTGWDVSDVNGATVTPSAAAVGNTMTLTGQGISVALNGTPSSTLITAADPATTNSEDVRQFTIPFKVTAGDDDIYVSGATGTGEIAYATTTTSTGSSTDQGTANLSVGDTVSGDLVGSYYKVLAGTTRNFTLNVTYTATDDGYTGLQLSSINYGTGTGMGQTYSSNLNTFKTPDVYMSYTN
ncbi:MAG: hypothetical protein UY97_C0001G0121 [Parcubacteria group bacterium GW2011_GWB1_57_6]|nr:MAG: hypothetical protein UY93_C0004G0009 [Parcubacteria group bacterium GW2011_GWA1_56_13]KKW47064.1 MAG: hypothetical protein UY97_C0001G0121 [Parcubacteria group bacterium GW2011_GWB1_57_6]